MAQEQKQQVETVYHVQVESQRGYEYDDEDAWNWFLHHLPDIVAAGAQALFNRSFGGRAHDGTRTTIVFITDPKKPVKPEQFFTDTEQVHFSINQFVDPNQPPELPKGATVVPAEVKFDVQG